MEFLKVLLPIFRIYQLCGFSPFSIPFDAKQPTQRGGQIKWQIYSGILIIYLIVLVIFNVASYQTFLDAKPSEMITYLNFGMIIGMRVLAVAVVVESALKSKQQQIFLQKLGNIVDILNQELGIGCDYKNMRLTAFIWITVWIVQNAIIMSAILVEVFGDYASNWERIKWILYTVPLIVSALKYYQITHYIDSLRFFFNIINVKLDKINANQNRLNIKDKVIKEPSEPIKKPSENEIFNEIVSLRRVYHILWECTTHLNYTFQWSLLLLIGASFIIIVVNYYRTLVWIIASNGTETEAIVIVTVFFWSVGHTFYFIKLSSTCYNVCDEVKFLSF